jgi:hypothetical protein
MRRCWKTAPAWFHICDALWAASSEWVALDCRGRNSPTCFIVWGAKCTYYYRKINKLNLFCFSLVTVTTPCGAVQSRRQHLRSGIANKGPLKSSLMQYITTFQGTFTFRHTKKNSLFPSGPCLNKHRSKEKNNYCYN